MYPERASILVMNMLILVQHNTCNLEYLVMRIEFYHIIVIGEFNNFPSLTLAQVLIITYTSNRII